MRHLFVMITLFSLWPIATTNAQSDQRCFSETGACISGPIRRFWEDNGGLPVFGYPIGPQQAEFVEGQPLQVQWFERNRLELHPSNLPPYQVLLGRLGDDRLRQIGRVWRNEAATGYQPTCRYFPETNQSICGDFLSYWQAHGLSFESDSWVTDRESLALWGMPLTAPILETNPNGDTVITQWFERARFELHPNNPAEYRVLGGLLGDEIRRNRTAPPPIIVGNYRYYSYDDGLTGLELWRTNRDGTNPQLVVDLASGHESSLIRQLTALGDQIYFFARGTSDLDDTLWRSDGTAQGTQKVVSTEQLNSPYQMVVMGKYLYFVANNPNSGYELWQSDGTRQGTQIVRELRAGTEGIYPEAAMPMGYTHFQLTVVGGTKLFFTAQSDAHGYGLWVTDGSSAGTQFVSNIGTPTNSAEFWSFTDLNGILMFVARTDRLQYGLYRSDGTPTGTRLVRDFSYPTDPGSTRLYPPLGDFVVRDQILWFNAFGQDWRSDGTTAGTYPW